MQGVYTTSDPDGIMTRAKAALRVCPSGTLLGGVTVLRLLGAWLPDDLSDQRIHVVVSPGVCGPQRAQIKVVRAIVPLPPVEFEDGVYGVHPAQAWFQITGMIRVADLVIVADSLMRRQVPMAAPSDFSRVLDMLPGRRGSKVARQALAMARAGVDSPMESRLRLAIVASGLPCPVVNHPLRPWAGGPQYYLDMAYPTSQLAIEYDGAVHVGNRAQMQSDRTRRRHVEDAGWRVLTATAADFANLAAFIDSIRRELRRRSSPDMDSATFFGRQPG